MTITPYKHACLGWRIATITFTAPPGLPGLRQSTINTIRTSDTSGPWVGWSFEVDGASLLMISPPGWQAGKAERTGEKVTVYEVSKALAAIAWEYEPPVDHGADHDGLGQPLRWRDGASEAGTPMTGIAEYIPAGTPAYTSPEQAAAFSAGPKHVLVPPDGDDRSPGLVVTAVDAATGTITLEQVAANEATIAAAVAAYASPLPVAAPVERDEPPDEPIVPAKRGPGRPRKAQ